jgi:hypothetical protein
MLVFFAVFESSAEYTNIYKNSNSDKKKVATKKISGDFHFDIFSHLYMAHAHTKKILKSDNKKNVCNKKKSVSFFHFCRFRDFL